MQVGSDYAYTCPVCRLRVDGRAHICPGEITHPEQALQGAQFLDEMTVPNQRRRYGERLEEGFEMMGYDTEAIY